MQHETMTRTLGEVLPGVLRQTTATASPERSTSASSALTVRLSDSQLAGAEAVAAAPLPALTPADAHFFAQSLKMLDTLPRQKTDTLGGELRIRAYEIAIGTRPRDAIQFLVTEALRTCKFFPSTSECIDILKRWERDDDALRMRREAATAARWERQARFDEVLARLAAGKCDQAEIDNLDGWTKQVAETRGYLRMEGGGRYTSRVQPKAPGAPA